MIPMGERIAERRKALGMTVEGLAKEAGVTTASIYRYSHGKREPTAYAIYGIAKALETTVEYLLVGA